MTNTLRVLLLGGVTLALAACASTGQPVKTSGKNPYDAKINAALERAADNASRQGSSAGSLALMEKLYARDPKNADNALKFAQALRANGDLQKATLVLTPFANRNDSTTDVLTEMATLYLNTTKYGQAENFARQAIAKDAGAYRAYQILGISLDAQNDYEPAEKAFRQALDLWQGDPIPVMNNLALNLTNQERLAEALEIMERAKAAAPNRTEVERNLRIIRTLNESASGRPAPKPEGKPMLRPTAVNAPASETAPAPETIDPAAGDKKIAPAKNVVTAEPLKPVTAAATGTTTPATKTPATPAANKPAAPKTAHQIKSSD